LSNVFYYKAIRKMESNCKKGISPKCFVSLWYVCVCVCVEFHGESLSRRFYKGVWLVRMTESWALTIWLHLSRFITKNVGQSLIINNLIGPLVDSLDNILFSTIMAAFHWTIESIKNDAVINAQVFTYIKITK